MGSCNDCCANSKKSEPKTKTNKIWWLVIALLFVVPLEILSLFSIDLVLWIKLPFFISIILIFGKTTIISGFKSLLKLNFSDINLLMTIAIIGAIFLQKYEEAAIIVVLFSLGEALEEYGLERSRKALEKLINNFPKTAELKSENRIVSIDQVTIGEVIIIRPGDQVGLDGEVVYGDSLVDESTITGEPLPKSKSIGDKIYAGSINSGGYLEVKVLKESKNSTLNKIVQLTENSLKRKADSQKFIEKFARYYTPAVTAFAVILFIIPVLFFNGSVAFWLVQSLTILLISCPCALVISTPISVFSAIGNASQKGILVKGGKAIEDLAYITEIGFDKTKTLTIGKPEVTDIIPFNGFTKEEVLSCSAGLSRYSEHPLSQGIVEKAKKDALNMHGFKNFQSVQGQGIVGECLVCTDVKHCLGKINLIDNQIGKMELNELMTREKERLEKEGKTVVFLGDEKAIKGLIALSDRIKDESKQVIKELKEQKIKCFMITGDNDGAAQYVSDSLGISEIHSGKLPEDKAELIINKSKNNIKVAMVGDGVNDAPSLAGASVGIAMGSLGSDIAIETADIALMNDDLKLIPYIIKLSKKTVTKIKFNTYFALGTKSIFLILAVMGISNLSLAIFADVGVTVIVVVNGLSLYRFK
ncbi:MAG: cation-translocating P-type ATPase [Candidatus Falkowbacteria bacterium]|nr:MAG: cation-translocating P-type ATPase [Candidatus Falkowbacteria bacterium]